MSTRTLIVLAAVTGVAILAASAIQIMLAQRDVGRSSMADMTDMIETRS